MTLTEILKAFEGAMSAVAALTGEVAAQRARIVALEEKVQQHDKELKTAPDPGHPVVTGRSPE